MKRPKRRIKPKRLTIPKTFPPVGNQEAYTRGCMLLLFHKSLYYHRDDPAITDAKFDALERRVEHLEGLTDVQEHPDFPTHKAPCPHESDLPRTVKLWLRRYDTDRQPPTMIDGVKFKPQRRKRA